LGCYYVKLGYKLLYELHNLDLNRPQVSNSQKGFWKNIWKLKVPGKVRHFLWKACTNSLPTKENLLKRKILHESGCSRCSGDSESVVHTLWSCSCIKEVWDPDFEWVDRSSTASNSFSDVLQKIHVKPALLPLFAVTAWSIWYQINKSRLQENLLPLRNIVGFAKNYLCEFKGLDSHHSHKRRATPPRWLPPSAGSMKTNYDGAMFRESDFAGIGVVIRNCEGQVLAALSKQIVKPLSVEILELLATWRAVSFTAESGYDQFVCEGDSESVVNSLRGSGMENSRGGHLIKDIVYLSNSFLSISFAHVCQQGNAVAHALAQRAR